MALDQYGGFGMGAPVPRRIYALVRLGASTKRGEVAKFEGGSGDGGVIEGIGGGMKIDGVTGVPYATTAASAPSHPRLTLLGGGAVVAIRFVDVVVFCARDSPYQDRLTLKAPNTDQILGLGMLPPIQPLMHSFPAEQEQGGGAGPEDVLILTAGVLMRARVDLGRIKSFDEATGRAILIRALLTQAILYGSNPDNPLHFSFPPEVDPEALMAGAEDLSRAVLESDPEIIRPNHDLTSQLTSRKDRLSWLIRFINDNAALGKMSQRSRQRLATDAEKLYACHQLWLKMNEHLDAGASHSLVTDAIHAFTAVHPLLHPSASHDVIRDFFRYRVAEIGRLIPFMVERIERAGEGAMREVGGAVVTILQAAPSYRAYNLAVYGVELPMIKPWTSRPSAIDGVLKLVDTATRFALDPSKANTKSASRDLLPELATVFFACVQERLDWLDSPIGADEPGSERDHIELKERFDQLRPEILETLRLTSHLPNALTLAASHADFRSLAALLHQDTVYPPSSNPHAHTIEEYVDRFGGMFAREVVRWCMVHGEARVVFAMEESGRGEWGKYMDEYWVEEDGQGAKSDAVAWLRDLGQGRWSVAGTRLSREAKGAGDVGVKHFMLSVGKLAHLAQMQESGDVDEAVLDAFHDRLDFISVQEKMLQEFREVASSLRGKQKQSLDAQVDAVIRTKGMRLRSEQRHGLLGIMKNFVRQVLQGKALSLEDAVDVLTLQNNAEGVENYATALQLLAHAEDIPDARRQSSFRRVWCRIYNHDEYVPFPYSIYQP
jgi:nuclear pore complex protein Nup133